MLKIICDVKCGFEDLYIVEKNLEFPLDFLTEEGELQRAYMQSTGKGVLTEEEVITLYAQDPIKFMTEYGVYNLMRSIIGADYASRFFQQVLDKISQSQLDSVFFPELFKIGNLKLIRYRSNADEAVQFNPIMTDPAGSSNSGYMS